MGASAAESSPDRRTPEPPTIDNSSAKNTTPAIDSNPPTSNVPAAGRSRSGFLELPPEIRESIFREFLAPENNVSYFDNGYKKYTFDLRLFRTSRQVYYEARRVFRRLNTFVAIETPWHEAEQHIAVAGYVPLLVQGDAATQFDGQHLTVKIDAPQFELQGQSGRRFILHLDDLPAFCEIWFYSNLTHMGLNAHLRLTLVIRDPYQNDISDIGIPKETQRRLLEPFGRVKDLSAVEVEGEHYKSIEKTMRDSMAQPHVPPEECLEEATRLKDAGNAALQKGEYQKALQLYYTAFRAIHIVIDGRRRSIWADPFFYREITNGIFKGQHGQLVRLELRVKLVANTVLALLKLDQVEEAHYWGMRSINLMREAVEGEEPVRDFVAAGQMGKIYYRTALACKQLGDESEARKLLRVAFAYLPHDEVVRKEMESLSLRIG